MPKKGPNLPMKRKNGDDEKNTKRVKTAPVPKPIKTDTNEIKITTVKTDADHLKKSKGKIGQASRGNERNEIRVPTEKPDHLKKSKGKNVQVRKDDKAITTTDKRERQNEFVIVKSRQEQIKVSFDTRNKKQILYIILIHR